MRSATARRLLEPAWLNHPVYVETYGPEVADLCAMVDFAPDPEQELLLDLTFAITPSGKSAAFEIDVVAARQQLKTGFLKQCEIGWLYVTEQRLVVHTAHELDTTAEAFRDLANMIESHSALSSRLAPTRGERQGITEGNGKWTIELVGDRRIRYKARTKSAGRGLTGDKVVLDEGQALVPAMMGALLPTLSARPDPQVVTAASACMPSSTVLRDKRERGRAGRTPNQVYAEWGERELSPCRDPKCTHAKTADGCAYDDPKVWAKFMPQLGGRVMVSTVRALRQSMPVDEFGREMMVRHEDPPIIEDEQIFGTSWNEQAVEDAKRPEVKAIGIAVSVDRAWSSIAMCGSHGDDTWVGAVDRRRGTHWLFSEVVRIATEHGCQVGIDGRGPAASLLSARDEDGNTLEDLLGGQLSIASTEDAKDAFGDFYEGVTDRHDIWHSSHPELDEAVAGATTRTVGDRPLIARKQSESDPAMLEAAVLAKWAAGDVADYDVLDSVI